MQLNNDDKFGFFKKVTTTTINSAGAMVNNCKKSHLYLPFSLVSTTIPHPLWNLITMENQSQEIYYNTLLQKSTQAKNTAISNQLHHLHKFLRMVLKLHFFNPP